MHLFLYTSIDVTTLPVDHSELESDRFPDWTQVNETRDTMLREASA
jgi:hypothetical protein